MLSKKDFPEVEHTMMMGGNFNRTVSLHTSVASRNQIILRRLIALVDSTFSGPFNIEMVKGDKQTALSKDRQIITPKPLR